MYDRETMRTTRAEKYDGGTNLRDKIDAREARNTYLRPESRARLV